MIVVCTQCATRLQLDDSKVPARAFTMRCPKCQSLINGQPPAAAVVPAEASAPSVEDAPTMEQPQPQQSKQATTATAARPFRVNNGGGDGQASSAPDNAPVSMNQLAHMLALVLQQNAPAKEKRRVATRLAWEHRRALVCVTPTRREAVARVMAENNYEVFIAEDTMQAVESMRGERMDVVLLDPEFDPIEQGAAFVTREINIMRPTERRRLFFVHLTATAHTADAHAAFLQNVNLLINPSDIENIPQVLERAIRDYNDLYQDFNNALNVAAI
jgi:predicted Zn finger-like uncharacterized protein